jgi:hypothetical protein
MHIMQCRLVDVADGFVDVLSAAVHVSLFCMPAALKTLLGMVRAGVKVLIFTYGEPTVASAVGGRRELVQPSRQ